MGPKSEHQAETLALQILGVQKSSVGVARAVIAKTLPVLLQLWFPLLILLGAGIWLIIVRIVLIHSAPTIILHSQRFAAWATAVRDSIDILMDIQRGITYAVRLVTNALHLGGVIKPAMPHFIHIPTSISSNAVKQFGMDLIACSNTTTRESVIFLSRLGANNAVCPILRAATPLRWVNESVIPHFNWLAFNYEPIEGADPITHLGNCQIPGPDELPFLELCASLRAGYIVVEVALPLAVGLLLVVTTIPQLAQLVWSVLLVFWAASSIIGQFVLNSV